MNWLLTCNGYVTVLDAATAVKARRLAHTICEQLNWTDARLRKATQQEFELVLSLGGLVHQDVLSEMKQARAVLLDTSDVYLRLTADQMDPRYLKLSFFSPKLRLKSNPRGNYRIEVGDWDIDRNLSIRRLRQYLKDMVWSQLADDLLAEDKSFFDAILYKLTETVVDACAAYFEVPLQEKADWKDMIKLNIRRYQDTKVSIEEAWHDRRLEITDRSQIAAKFHLKEALADLGDWADQLDPLQLVELSSHTDSEIAHSAAILLAKPTELASVDGLPFVIQPVCLDCQVKTATMARKGFLDVSLDLPDSLEQIKAYLLDNGLATEAEIDQLATQPDQLHILIPNPTASVTSLLQGGKYQPQDEDQVLFGPFDVTKLFPTIQAPAIV